MYDRNKTVAKRKQSEMFREACTLSQSSRILYELAPDEAYGSLILDFARLLDCVHWARLGHDVTAYPTEAREAKNSKDCVLWLTLLLLHVLCESAVYK